MFKDNASYILIKGIQTSSPGPMRKEQLDGGTTFNNEKRYISSINITNKKIKILKMLKIRTSRICRTPGNVWYFYPLHH